jgi:glycosyltransferase involved in cell wall biosynthesis
LLVACMDRHAFYDRDVQDLGVQVRYVTRRYRWDPFVFAAVHRMVSDFRPAVIHTTGLVSSFYALPVAKWHGVPVVNGLIRNAFGRRHLRWRMERMLLKCSDIRVANSEAGLQSRQLSSSSGRDFVVYNGFDLDRVKILPPDRGLVSGPVVGMVAEFNRHKDYATFISAALRLLPVRHDVTFVAVGDGETLAAMKGLVPDKCGGIMFLGRRHDVETIVSGFSIGVLSTFNEGISNSIMEYMALAKPVVVTDGGGSQEIVLDGKTGFLVPPRDPGALADRIAYLLDWPEEATRMGEAGRRRIGEHFSLEIMTEKTVALYEQAILLSSAGAHAETMGSRVV